MIELLSTRLLCFIIRDYKVELPEALQMLHNSDTFAKLEDPETGLYIESPGFIYSIFKDELTHGRIIL